MESKFLLRTYCHEKPVPERTPFQVRTLDGSVYYWSLEQSNSPYFLVKFKRGWRYYSVYLKSGGWWSGKLLVLAHTWDLHPLSDVYLLPDEFKKNCPALKGLTSLEIDKKIGDPDYKFIAGYKGKKSPVVYINTDINFDEVVEKKEIPFEVFAYAEKLVTFTDKAIEEFTDLESKPEVKRQVEIEKKKENRDVLKGVLGLGFLAFRGYSAFSGTGSGGGGEASGDCLDFPESSDELDGDMDFDGDDGISFTGSYNENEAEYWELKAEDASDKVEEYLHKASEAIKDGDEGKAKMFNKWAEEATATRNRCLEFAKSHRDKL